MKPASPSSQLLDNYFQRLVTDAQQLADKYALKVEKQIIKSEQLKVRPSHLAVGVAGRRAEKHAHARSPAAGHRPHALAEHTVQASSPQRGAASSRPAARGGRGTAIATPGQATRIAGAGNGRK